MSVIVAHPDTQHSAHAALGLKRAGLLRFLFTSFSLQRPASLGRVVRNLAPGMYRRMAQHHAHEGLIRGELRVFPPHLLASRCGERAWLESQKLFARLAGRMGVRSDCGVMAFNTNAVWTFRILKRAGLPCILDQTIAHRRWSDRVGQAECDSHPGWGDSWSAPPWRADLEDEEIALADIVLCGSDFCVSTMRTEGVPAQKMVVVPYGADTRMFRPAPVEARVPGLRVLFVGSVSLRKGVHHLLEAAARLRGLGIRVTLAGTPRIRLEALAPYADFVHLTGFRLHEEMPLLYQQHDLYVFPSIVEGSSLSIYEALASGLPVITTPNAGSIARDGVEGFIVPAGDVDALSSVMERVARDEDLRRTLASGARKRAEEAGDWIHYGARLAEAIAPAVTGRRPG